MKTKKTIALLAILVVLGASSIAISAEKGGRGSRDGRGPRDGKGTQAGQQQQGGPGGIRRGERPEMGSGHMMGFGGFEKLDLTKEQREVIAEIRREAMKKMMEDIKKVLTDEQAQKLERYRERNQGGDRDGDRNQKRRGDGKDEDDDEDDKPRKSKGRKGRK